MTNIPDPRVLSDETTYIATQARTLRLIADGLLGDREYNDLPPTDPKWIGHEIGHVADANHIGLDVALLEQVRHHPERVLLAGYVARTITTRLNHYPLGGGSLAFIHDLEGQPWEDLIAFVCALPSRLRRAVTYNLQFVEDAMAKAPADLDVAVGMVEEFAHEPIGRPEATALAPWDDQGPDTLGGMSYALLAKVCVGLCTDHGPDAVAGFLATLNHPDCSARASWTRKASSTCRGAVGSTAGR